MSLTYMPNANEIPKTSSGRSAAPIVAGLVVLLLIVVAVWFALGGSGSSTTAATTAPVTHAGTGAAAKPIEAVYGTKGEHFKVAFGSTPIAQADTGGIITAFPPGASVSGYAVTTVPNSVFQDQYTAANHANVEGDPLPTSAVTPNPVTVPTRAVLTATLLDGEQYLTTMYVDSLIAAIPGSKRVKLDGFVGAEYRGPVKPVLGKGAKITDPTANIDILMLFKGRTAYQVYALAPDEATTHAFVASFRPVKDPAGS